MARLKWIGMACLLSTLLQWRALGQSLPHIFIGRGIEATFQNRTSSKRSRKPPGINTKRGIILTDAYYCCCTDNSFFIVACWHQFFYTRQLTPLFLSSQIYTSWRWVRSQIGFEHFQPLTSNAKLLPYEWFAFVMIRTRMIFSTPTNSSQEGYAQIFPISAIFCHFLPSSASLLSHA